MDPAELITALGGIVKRSTLIDHGASPRELESAARAGLVRRILRGWYTVLDDSDPRVVAVRSGGVLTGPAALRLDGAWLWHRPRRIDVLVARGAVATPVSGRVRIIVGGRSRNASAIAPLPVSLEHAVKSLPLEEAVAVLDWAARTEALPMEEIGRICARLPLRLRPIRRLIDPACDSVLESVARTRLLREGRHVTSQVPVGAVNRIDLVVDDVVALELDGRKDHSAAFESDRRKDGLIVRDGLISVRASYSMVRDEWTAVSRTVAAAASSHRAPRRARTRPPRHPLLRQ